MRSGKGRFTPYTHHLTLAALHSPYYYDFIPLNSDPSQIREILAKGAPTRIVGDVPDSDETKSAKTVRWGESLSSTEV